MARRAAAFFALLQAARGAMPWAFSWDTLSTFAFPGDAPRFMTPDEEQHFSNFSMMLICAPARARARRTANAAPAKRAL